MVGLTLQRTDGFLQLPEMHSCLARRDMALQESRTVYIWDYFLNKDKFVVTIYHNFADTRSGEASADQESQCHQGFPYPANPTDSDHSGLVNQLAEFTLTLPLQPSLYTSSDEPPREHFRTPDHDEAFHDQVSTSVHHILAASTQTCLSPLQTDASRLNGIGYALLKDHGSGHLRLVQCGSQFLTDAETRYATIELEMLAVVWSMSKCRLYLAGLQNFTLMTDHRPLIPILNHYSLDAIENPRLQRLKEKISPYLFTAVWRAGKSLNIPDALSRAPVSHPTPEDKIAGALPPSPNSHGCVHCHLFRESPAQDADRTLQNLRDAARTDPAHTLLKLDCVTRFLQ
ncbi:uncharacterized protein [Macrobrachium rosenbergii]|uniref:uncharacterized protein n=1 Tax=Macrobrachium rosenbergii TaxID=79674 RepID=UPI0034D5B2EB